MNGVSVEETTARWMQRLEAAGYRLTAPRRAVVETMAASQYMLSPMDIHARARGKSPHLGLVTVYRTLEKLEELGLIQRVHRPDSCQAFIAAAPGHQHLLVCQNCGRVEYFSGDRLEPLISAVSGESGYQIQGHWLQLFGVCDCCSESKG